MLAFTTTHTVMRSCVTLISAAGLAQFGVCKSFAFGDFTRRQCLSGEVIAQYQQLEVELAEASLLYSLEGTIM